MSLTCYASAPPPPRRFSVFESHARTDRLGYLPDPARPTLCSPRSLIRPFVRWEGWRKAVPRTVTRFFLPSDSPTDMRLIIKQKKKKKDGQNRTTQKKERKKKPQSRSKLQLGCARPHTAYVHGARARDISAWGGGGYVCPVGASARALVGCGGGDSAGPPGYHLPAVVPAGDGGAAAEKKRSRARHLPPAAAAAAQQQQTEGGRAIHHAAAASGRTARRRSAGSIGYPADPVVIPAANQHRYMPVGPPFLHATPRHATPCHAMSLPPPERRYLGM